MLQTRIIYIYILSTSLEHEKKIELVRILYIFLHKIELVTKKLYYKIKKIYKNVTDPQLIQIINKFL